MIFRLLFSCYLTLITLKIVTEDTYVKIPPEAYIVLKYTVALLGGSSKAVVFLMEMVGQIRENQVYILNLSHSQIYASLP